MLVLVPYPSSALLTSASRIVVEPLSQHSELPFNGKDGVWVVDWTSGLGDDERLEGSIRPSDVRSLSDGSLATEQTFTIRSSSTKNICRYDLVRRAEPMIVRLVPVRFDINVFGKTIDEAHAIALSEANSRGRSSLVPNNFVWRIASLFGRITSTKTTVFTLREDRQIATPGAIQNKRVDFETSWVFAATGQQPEQISVLCRGGCAAGTTEKSSNVWIQWKGNLVSGSECEDAADFKATYNRDVSGWQITDKASYITYTTYLQASAYDDLLRYANGAVSICEAANGSMTTSSSIISSIMVIFSSNVIFSIGIIASLISSSMVALSPMMNPVIVGCK